PRVRGRDREGASTLMPFSSPLPTPPPRAGEGADRACGCEIAANSCSIFFPPARQAGSGAGSSARGARIPVTVVTGFLGAGKTTLVRRFLATPEGAGTAVVINEFGSVGIDDALLRASSDDVTLIGNGCLCCNTRSDLQNALRNLVAERAQGTVPQFKRILIETSGLADPGPILQTFATDRALGGEFHVEVVIAVVDAVGGHARMVGGSEKADHPRRPAGHREDRSRQGASGEAPDRAADRAQPACRRSHRGQRRS